MRQAFTWTSVLPTRLRASASLLTLAAAMLAPGQAFAATPTSLPDVPYGEVPAFQGKIVDTAATRAAVHQLASASDAEAMTLAVTTHQVAIRVAGDEEWRAFYGTTNWDNRAEDAIEAADNSMITKFGIDLIALKFYNWDSAPDTGTCSQVLNDLKLVSKNGNDVVMGFSKQAFSAGGCEQGDYALIRYQGPSNDWKVTQHEMSHLYGADDVAGGTATHPNDVMEDPYNGYNTWCTTVAWHHFQTVSLNSGKYD